MSTAADVLGCFYFCPLDCDALVMVVDCAAVETGCMPEKKKNRLQQNTCSSLFFGLGEVMVGGWIDSYVLCSLFSLGAAASAAARCCCCPQHQY